MKKHLILLTLLVVSGKSLAVNTTESLADLQKQILAIEERLKEIKNSQARATNIDPEFNDDFDREIAEKQKELQELKSKLTQAI